MPNRISGYKATQPLAPVKGLKNAQVGSEKASSGPAASGAAVTADHVTLTDSARSLQKLAEALANAPVVDAAKVASLKQSIGNGTYTINPGRIADKLLQSETELK